MRYRLCRHGILVRLMLRRLANKRKKGKETKQTTRNAVCCLPERSHVADRSAPTDFDHPQGSLKGIIAAAYSLGAILSLPFIPIVNDRFGRRWSIFGGSLIMVIGALIQGFSQHGELFFIRIHLPFLSWAPFPQESGSDPHIAFPSTKWPCTL